MAGLIYPDIYRPCRKAFIDAAKEITTDIKTYTLPGFFGPYGEKLCSDVVSFGEGPRTLVIISGEHGDELRAWSQAKIRFMRKYRCKEYREKFRGVRFKFAHAINPFGSAYILRGDQYQVDANRNLLMDFKNLPAVPDKFEEFCAAITPVDMSEKAIAIARGNFYQLWNEDSDLLIKTLMFGQYQHPHRIIYGGHELSWSSLRFLDFAKNDVLSEKPEKVIAVHGHTGFRPEGSRPADNQAMFIGIKDSSQHKFIEKALQPENLAPINVTVLGPSGNTSASTMVSGPPAAHWYALAEQCNPKPDVMPVAPESYSAVSFDRVMFAKGFRLASWQCGDKAPMASMAIGEMLDAFDSLMPGWRRNAVNNNMPIIERSAAALANG